MTTATSIDPALRRLAIAVWLLTIAMTVAAIALLWSRSSPSRSRTIAYALVSAILAVVSAGVIILLSTALASFAQGETIAVAASTLTAFVAFQPVLRRVRQDVERRFNRAHYDAEQTVVGFSARLRDQVDIETVTADLQGTVLGAVNPSLLGLWIREARP